MKNIIYTIQSAGRCYKTSWYKHINLDHKIIYFILYFWNKTNTKMLQNHWCRGSVLDGVQHKYLYLFRDITLKWVLFFLYFTHLHWKLHSFPYTKISIEKLIQFDFDERKKKLKKNKNNRKLTRKKTFNFKILWRQNNITLESDLISSIDTEFSFMMLVYGI